MSHDDGDLVAEQLGGGIGGELGLALIVLCDEFELLTEYAAFGVHFGDNDFRCVQAGYAICGEVARMGAGNANLNGVFGLSGGGHGCGKQGCGHELEKMFHFHSS